MITFEDYFDLLKQRKKIVNYFNDEAKAIAENAKYCRDKKVVKKQQKDHEKARASGLNVYYVIYNKKLREKGVKISAVKQSDNKESSVKTFFKKLFRIKPKEIAGEIEELTEKVITTEEHVEQPDIETTGTAVDSNAWDIEDDELDEEDLGGPEYTEEELDELYPNDTIKGQMDIEELNEGDVYEKETEE